MSPQLASAVYVASAWVIPLVIAITFHEASHGYVARLCSDDTAWRLGRVSFNPLKHIDPFGTILLPALLLLMRSPLIGLLFILPLLGAQLGIDLNIVWQLVQRTSGVIIDAILRLTGNR